MSTENRYAICCCLMALTIAFVICITPTQIDEKQLKKFSVYHSDGQCACCSTRVYAGSVYAADGLRAYWQAKRTLPPTADKYIVIKEEPEDEEWP